MNSSPTKSQVRKWVRALRSGDYPHGLWVWNFNNFKSPSCDFKIRIWDTMGFTFDEIADCLESVYLLEVLG